MLSLVRSGNPEGNNPLGRHFGRVILILFLNTYDGGSWTGFISCQGQVADFCEGVHDLSSWKTCGYFLDYLWTCLFLKSTAQRILNSAYVENGKSSHADLIGLLIDKRDSTAVLKLYKSVNFLNDTA